MMKSDKSLAYLYKSIKVLMCQGNPIITIMITINDNASKYRTNFTVNYSCQLRACGQWTGN